ncbi:hypothetical protein AMTR_s00010p00025560 [Amborella trichopoda]|uniref:Uncharacterized protein n=1 Tax=Amborella trichopoda TaxID=13333 RepID=W1NFR2_AMBTC|nr:hypothetical protein AMTR_s00010p00025560 [Amborella trichopoda]
MQSINPTVKALRLHATILKAHLIEQPPETQNQHSPWIWAITFTIGTHTFTISGKRENSKWDPQDVHLEFLFNGHHVSIPKDHPSTWTAQETDVIVERMVETDSVIVCLPEITEVFVGVSPVMKSSGDFTTYLEVQFRIFKIFPDYLEAGDKSYKNKHRKSWLQIFKKSISWFKVSVKSNQISAEFRCQPMGLIEIFVAAYLRMSIVSLFCTDKIGTDPGGLSSQFEPNLGVSSNIGPDSIQISSKIRYNSRISTEIGRNSEWYFFKLYFVKVADFRPKIFMIQPVIRLSADIRSEIKKRRSLPQPETGSQSEISDITIGSPNINCVIPEDVTDANIKRVESDISVGVDCIEGHGDENPTGFFL